MFVAVDKTLNDLVVIKKVRTLMNGGSIESESQLLKECHSRYIVRYYDVVKKEYEFWVRYLWHR